MPKSRKKKKNIRKRTTTKNKKRTYRTNAAGDARITAIDTLRSKTRSGKEKLEDFVEASEERASIISTVKDIEGQVETIFKLNEILEAQLNTAQKKLSEELATRAQSEVQVESLEAQAALAKQLREDISFAEEERNKIANLLAQTQSRLEEVTGGRDSLAERMASAETNVKELEREKMALEAQVMNLKDKNRDADRLRKELAEITKAHRDSREQVHDLTKRLEASEASKDALERELAGTHQNARTLQAVVKKLQDELTGADNRTTDLRIQLEGQQVTNRELMETNTRLENEIKTLNIRCEAANNELDAFKNSIRDIRSEATQTSGRVHQKYFKPAGNSNKKVRNSASRKRKRKRS
ncbi:MAG: hypothetical protein ACYTEW_24325 [Planctomycetota bacterium]|jgi:chromosome segregation ATPase